MTKEISDNIRKMHELVQADHALRQNANPDISFSMSKDLVAKTLATKVRLSKELDLPRNKRKRKEAISQMKDTLIKEGVPFWVKI